MFRPSLHSFDFGLLVLLFLVPTIRATTARNWTNPNALLPSFSSTYLVGERIYLSWKPLNQSVNDLWLIRYNTADNYTLRIASTLDLSQPGSFPWTIAVSQEEVEADTRFMFAFVPTGTGFDPATDTGLDSPAFNLMMVNQNTPPNGTASPSAAQTTSFSGVSTITATSSSSSAPSNSSVASDSGSHSGTVKTASIAAGVLAAVGLVCLVAGYFIFKRRQLRHKQKLQADTDAAMTGPYSALGSKHAPVEMNSKEVWPHEMAASKETLAHESDSSPIHEVANTVKRPGLHEMAG